MIGTEVIAQVRTAFGEDSALSLTDVQIRGMVNQALRELHSWLPPEQNLPGTVRSPLSLTVGAAVVPHDWDQVLEVGDSTGPFTRIDPPIVANIDRLGRFVAPEIPTWSFDGERIEVRPTSISTVFVVHTEPLEITNWSAEITQLGGHLLAPLIHLTTSLAYAQEEDAEQAALYRGFAQSAVVTRVEAPHGDVG